MAFEFSYEWALPYWRGQKKHKNYFNALDVYEHLSFHFDGYFRRPWKVQSTEGTALNPFEMTNAYFTRLIDQQRPSESVVIKDYRRDQYRPLTKVPCSKVTNCLKKIVKSSDWKISYEKAEQAKSIPTGQTLYDYCEKNFPKDDSIENWAYKTLIKWMLVDPNAAICVMPLSFETEANELLRPYPHIIPCKSVLDYKEGEYCVFVSPYVVTLENDGKKKDGKIIMVVTTDSYIELRQTDDDENPFEVIEHKHNVGHVPCWIMGGENKSPDYTAPFYDSFVSGMLPSLDSAAVDSSDLQAEKVLHLYSLMWAYQSQQCNQCQGVGNVLTNGQQAICPTCEGRGVMPFSPFRVFEINANNPALAPNSNLPTPPLGYVEKDTKIVELMMEIIRREMNDALAAVNMEHLMDTPLSESGISKAYDTEETNNFVYSIAYHLVAELLVPIYYFINEIRYNPVLGEVERKKQLPHINIPERFDFLIQRDAEDNLIKITSDANGVSGDIKDAAEMAYAHAKFQDNPQIINRLNLIHDHDPLPGFSTEQIQSLVSAGLVSKQDGVLSIYLKSFITEVLADDEDGFMAMDYDEQREILDQMAADKTEELDAAKQIMRQVTAKEDVDAEGNPISQVGQKFVDRKTGKMRMKKDNSLENG